MRTGSPRRLPHYPRFATAADLGRLLLLLLLVARAWVPTGYMPDAQALRQGRLTLGFCTAGGNALAALQAMSLRQASTGGHHEMHGHHDHHGSGQGDDRGAGQECPFGLSAHQILNLPPLAALAPVLLHWLAQPPLNMDGPRPPMPATGPPLGPRAPPSIDG